jgi:tetratricopeptide (TPR) repeat protein
LTGPAGVGKTRLTIQLATSLNGSWVTGKLRPRAVEVIRAIIACSEPTLVVIEANGWQPEITAILDELAELDTANPYSVKLLLVSRHRDWLTYLRSKVRADTAGLIDAAKLLPLDQVGGPKDLLRWYGEARVTFADLLGQPAPPETSHGPPTGTTFGDLLSLAYASVVTSNTGVALSTAGEVADVLAEQERLQWPEPDVMITDDLRMRIVAALILCGGVDDAEQAATAITRLPELLDAPRERIRDITRWAGRIYPGSNWFSMPSLELLTHGLAVPALRDPDLRKSLISDRDVITVARIGSFLIGAANTYPEAEAWIRELLQPADLAEDLTGLMFGSADIPAPPQARTDHFLAALISQITERTILMQLESVLSDEIGYPRGRIALKQALVVNIRASYSHDEPTAQAADLAAALIGLARALHDFARYDEALAADMEAFTLLRQLADEQPAHHEHDLARAQTDLADMLRHLGRYGDALLASQEATAVLQGLAEQQRGREFDLARAQRILGLVLGDVGRYAEALTTHDDAVTLVRKLAEEDPARKRDLAGGLTNLGSALRSVGRYAEALTTHDEAVTIVRKLADEQPTRYQPNLANALTNFGAALHSVGRNEEDGRHYDQALEAHQEAVNLLQELAYEQPTRYQPDLAHALTNLGGVLGSIGKHHEALAAEQKAVKILRKLADEQPARQRDFARALINLGSSLYDVGQHDKDARRYTDALATEQKAVGLLRKLANGQPARHLPDLVHALIALGALLHSVGKNKKDARRHDEALAADREAVMLLRPLADEHPARFQPELADALRNRADVLRSVGRYDEALAAYKESRTLFMAVASDQPWHGSDVTKLDEMIRKLRLDLGRDEK